MEEWLWLIKTLSFLSLCALLGGAAARFLLGLRLPAAVPIAAFVLLLLTALGESYLTLSAAIGPPLIGDLIAYTLESGHGMALLVRVLGGALMSAALLSSPHWLAAALAALPLVYGFSAAGHARLGPSWALPTDMLHTGAMGLWAGAVAYAALAGKETWKAWRKERRSLHTLSALALGCVILVSLSGILSSVERLPSLFALTSPYGLLLLLKVFVFLFVLVIGAVIRTALLKMPDLRYLRWTLRGEVLLLCGILSISGIMTASPPPQNLAGQPAQELQIYLAGQELTAQLSFAGAGRMTVRLEGSSFSQPLYANLHMTGHPMPATPVILQKEDGGYSGETTLWMPGTYLLELKHGQETVREAFDIQ